MSLCVVKLSLQNRQKTKVMLSTGFQFSLVLSSFWQSPILSPHCLLLFWEGRIYRIGGESPSIFWQDTSVLISRTFSMHNLPNCHDGEVFFIWPGYTINIPWVAAPDVPGNCIYSWQFFPIQMAPKFDFTFATQIPHILILYTGWNFCGFFVPETGSRKWRNLASPPENHGIYKRYRLGNRIYDSPLLLYINSIST